MFVSIFDLFKVGIGPSSSHTMGPMVAAQRFLARLQKENISQDCRLRATFYGSLAFTGKGHASDRAVMLGLLGHKPSTLDPDKADGYIEDLMTSKSIAKDGCPLLSFDPITDIMFDYGPALKAHPNGMVFQAFHDEAEVLKRTYYSIGGGFVLSAEELEEMHNQKVEDFDIPYPFDNAKQMLEIGASSGLSIAQMQHENEKAIRSDDDITQSILNIWGVMNACLERGLKQDGILPGKLKVKRRAANIKQQIDNEFGKNDQEAHICNEWLSVYAMAVNEENAAGGRVVTAPTNGAAGVIPAVVRYYIDFMHNADVRHIPTFLLTAAAIGSIIKRNASISGAEVGCQGEVGSASAMAAAGLCAVMGGTNQQIENAAEIALEHHLGMTCDPVAGLVQVPCIERNGLGAVKAVTAAALSMRGNGEHFVPLDSCIETMRQTGMDMRSRYKETSRGGLAVNVIEC